MERFTLKSIACMAIAALALGVLMLPGQSQSSVSAQEMSQGTGNSRGTPDIQIECPESGTNPVAAADAAKKFYWKGSCQVQCSNGQCRLVCDEGAGYATTYNGARIQAEATMRETANQSGRVVAGTLQISIQW